MELSPSKGVSKIVMTKGKMTVSMYVDIMSQNLKKSIRNLSMGRRYICQRDNDLRHTSKISEDYFSKNKKKKKKRRKKKKKKLEWPPQRPDLNPISNLWSVLNKIFPFEERRNKNQSFETIKNVWRNINQGTTQKLVDGLNQRLKVVIEAKEGPYKH
ncbi:hypothetical protein AVEN_256551-1 [Araneus ventricosus]|uniref:Tc1-like transposase DDE domain-containing protein n=1 Tax=Araneus ventricosus TaxID=182803 RepID=A0A4Y2KBP1_ARAVE|nr:hypothetical protein AVEN_256551-1 [Araneus ventricosus]